MASDNPLSRLQNNMFQILTITEQHVPEILYKYECDINDNLNILALRCFDINHPNRLFGL